MPRPIQSQEVFADLLFPVYGESLITEFELQPTQTTPYATNCRGFESITFRMRGGSRTGLTQYIPQQLPGFVQDLNILVDPTEAALLAYFPYPIGTPTTLDPNTGFPVPIGGAGWMMPKDPGPPSPPGPPVPPVPPVPPSPPPPGTSNWWAGTVVTLAGGNYQANVLGAGSQTVNQLSVGGTNVGTTIPLPEGAIGVIIGTTYYMAQPYWIGEQI